MRSPKQSDSPSGYDREICPRRILDVVGHQERTTRRKQDERWYDRMSTCLSTDMRPADDFDGCVD